MSVSVALGVAVSCSSAEKKKADGKAEDVLQQKEMPTLARRCGKEANDEGLRVVRFDVNGDGRPDVWKFFKTVTDKGTGKEKEFLGRKELDLNFDGRVDVWRDYNEAGDLTKEEFDLDFDCKVDWITTYEGGKIVKKEGDLGFGGVVNVWMFFKNGKLIRKEKSSKNNGKVDTWEFFDNGKLERIERDVDGDGKPDMWERPKDAPAPVPPKGA